MSSSYQSKDSQWSKKTTSLSSKDVHQAGQTTEYKPAKKAAPAKKATKPRQALTEHDPLCWEQVPYAAACGICLEIKKIRLSVLADVSKLILNTVREYELIDTTEDLPTAHIEMAEDIRSLLAKELERNVTNGKEPYL